MAAAAAFLETYLDCVESLPGELARGVSQLYEIDIHTRAVLGKLEGLCEQSTSALTDEEKNELLAKLQKAQLELRAIGDEKMSIASSMQETAEDYYRRLEIGAKNFEKARAYEEPLIQPFSLVSANRVETPVSIVSETTEKPKKAESNASNTGTSSSMLMRGTKRLRVDRDEDGQESKPKDQGTKKKVKVKRSSKQSTSREVGHHNHHQQQQQGGQGFLPLPASTPVPDFTTEPIDPNEPTYCLCSQVSFGEMIGCDNEECPIEWFHFQCVGLTSKPKGKWYCPLCKQDSKSSKNTR